MNSGGRVDAAARTGLLDAEVSPRHLHNHIGGRWRPPAGGGTRPNLNPARRDDTIGRFAVSGAGDASAAVAAAAHAGPSWRDRGPVARAELLRAAERLLGERAENFARVITREQGKLLREARGEVRRARQILEFVAGEGRRLNGVTTPADDPRTMAYTFRAPLGVVGLIAPWNFPLAIPLWKVAPALLSGCTAVLKPSPLTPYTAALLVQLFQDAGVPDGVLNLLQGGRAAGEALVADERVVGVSFTGSVPVGVAIQQAGAGRLLRTQLELGGKNAAVVLDDADLDRAAEAITAGAFGQSGQRCSATSRVVVDRRVRSELLDRLADLAGGIRVGPGAEENVDMGPVITADSLAACLAAVAAARGDGARLLCGGGRAGPGLPDGNFLQPTILHDVAPDAGIAQRELFGPVLAVITADGTAEAVRIANAVPYGLSAAVFTRDVGRAFDAVHRLDAGMLHVNRAGVGAFAHLPHVGTKASQYGPPECSPQVWDFYTEWRSVCVRY